MDSKISIFENVIPLSVKVAEAESREGEKYLLSVSKWKSIYGL